MSYSRNQKVSRPSRWRRSLPIIGGVVILAVLVIAGLELTNTTHIFHKAPLKKVAVISTSSSTSKAKAAKAKAAAKSASSSTTSTTAVTTTTPSSTKTTVTSSNSSATLTDPYGDFISNHKANLGDTETSACNTTAGATCTITLAMGGIIRSLPAQVTDSNGFTSWDNWTLSDGGNGFSNGTWTIKATATLNGQTKSVSDPRNLEIGS